jgi:hypothetical protein
MVDEKFLGYAQLYLGTMHGRTMELANAATMILPMPKGAALMEVPGGRFSL